MDEKSMDQLTESTAQPNKKKNWKHRAAVGAVCAATSAGVLMGGAFDSPADLLDDDDSAAAAVTIQMYSDDDAAGQGDDEERQRKSSPLRRWFLNLPMGVRAVVGVPLWGLGWCVLSALGLLWQGLLTPLGGKLLGWLLTAALTLGVTALTAKALFPHVPLRKLLHPRLILWVTGGILLLGLVDTAAPLMWKDYPPIGTILRLGGSAVMTAAACLSLRKLHRLHPAPVKSVAHKTVEQQAMELADSVCAPRYHP